ncbi:MAG TPA: enoyl-CoA hydratase/isomerase family protein, partial [Acidimicrobiia bacterium]|nr:enoyl-CoA hydratase/isomerase family protein [Acidimicrobiia bacterium]
YMGSLITGMLESLGRSIKPDPDAFKLDHGAIADDPHQLTDAVRDNDGRFPPDWRLSHRGRAQP